MVARIALITSSEQPVSLFAELAEALHAESKELEFEEFYVPTALDIPMQAKQCSDFDLVFAFYLFDKEEEFKVRILLEGLIKAELENNVKIIKAVEEFEGIDSEQELQELKHDLVEKWSQIVLGVLFDPEAFKPQDSVGEDTEGEGEGELEEGKESESAESEGENEEESEEESGELSESFEEEEEEEEPLKKVGSVGGEKSKQPSKEMPEEV